MPLIWFVSMQRVSHLDLITLGVKFGSSQRCWRVQEPWHSWWCKCEAHQKLCPQDSSVPFQTLC